jgi:hypothetical protein
MAGVQVSTCGTCGSEAQIAPASNSARAYQPSKLSSVGAAVKRLTVLPMTQSLNEACQPGKAHTVKVLERLTNVRMLLQCSETLGCKSWPLGCKSWLLFLECQVLLQLDVQHVDVQPGTGSGGWVLSHRTSEFSLA